MLAGRLRAYKERLFVSKRMDDRNGQESVGFARRRLMDFRTKEVGRHALLILVVIV